MSSPPSRIVRAPARYSLSGAPAFLLSAASAVRHASDAPAAPPPLRAAAAAPSLASILLGLNVVLCVFLLLSHAPRGLSWLLPVGGGVATAGCAPPFAPATPPAPVAPTAAAILSEPVGAGDEGFILLTDFYGRFSNNIYQVAELVGLGVLLNRSVLLPWGGLHGKRGLGSALHLPALAALGVRPIADAERAAAACPRLDIVFAVAGIMFNGGQPQFTALAPGVTITPDAVVSLNALRRVPVASYRPDDGGPVVAAPASARAQAWAAYPYPLLIDAPSGARWSGDAGDGIVFPTLAAQLRAQPLRCLAVDSPYLALDWRPHPALFRAVFGALTAPPPGIAAAAAAAAAAPPLGGAPYAALHLRLTDYCGSGDACSPAALERALAPMLRAMLAAPACAAAAGTLLLLTDEPGNGFITALRAALQPATALVALRAEQAAGALPDASDDVALILLEQTLAARAACFMGSNASTFSGLIRVRRDIARLPWETFMPWQYEAFVLR